MALPAAGPVAPDGARAAARERARPAPPRPAAVRRGRHLLRRAGRAAGAVRRHPPAHRRHRPHQRARAWATTWPRRCPRSWAPTGWRRRWCGAAPSSPG
nr:hypothetical protein [Angustibacter aerolatus]